MKTVFIVILSGLLTAAGSYGCTNYLITKGASTDGSTMISYAADSHVLYGELYHWPAAEWPEGTMMDIYEWDTGKFLGQIKQAPVTYNVVGNINEWQVAIGETTYGGLKQLGSQDDAIMDYGSLIYVTLQRAESARDAIRIMAELVEKYGYASSGESFSIADKNEVWIMEMIGKGQGEKGAVWVARLIPDGYVSGHANQARITTFPLENKKESISSNDMEKIYDEEITTVYAADVISFAKEKGLYEGPDKKFSFSDVYAPVDFGGARFCEIRVWTMFNKVTEDMDEYWEYAKGHIEHPAPQIKGQPITPENYASNRMPLWVKPEKKISVHDMMMFMRDHLEGTELDMSKDVGAGPFGNPYRWRPLYWEVDSMTYCNERATATQQTGFSFVTQSRNWLPDPIGGIIWFGVDDAASSVYVPMYCGITEAPESFAQGNGGMMTWSDDAAFWIFNQVTNFAYTRYNLIHPEIAELQNELEQMFIDYTPAVDLGAVELYNQNKELGIEYITTYSSNQGDYVTETWKEFYKYLFMKYMDGNVKTPREVPEGYKYIPPHLEQPGYGENWYRRIVDETGDQFKVIGGGH
ncbi:MAG: C69 family dipeptidase [Bacteroidales bacterium]|nr:C69 family dipeptidase [Bacteroidales bacterium]MCF8343071.1 C69 family dipeptidase [Bacteroidales bacterium]MCF8349966.1 C69 family dipeptidase [Bacteroidales bacterium]MCF8376708.1 C69 family dipeptidase [Bacteroidales bacterium]